MSRAGLRGPFAPGEARGRGVGFWLAAMRRTIDQEGPMLQAMYKRWPDDVEVVRRVATRAETTKDSIAIFRRALARNKHSTELWIELVYAGEASDRAAVLDEAARVLTPDELAVVRARVQ